MADTVVSIKSIRSGLSDFLKTTESRVNLIEGYLNRIVKQEYINSQGERFQVENAGPDFEGGKWAPLDDAYQTYKEMKYASYPGGGSKLVIRTSNLMNSLLLSDSYYPSPEPKRITAGRKGKMSKGEMAAGSVAVVDATSIYIYTLVPYAQFVDEIRTFTRWSDQFWTRINQGIIDYLTGKNGSE